jgi:sensor c-di-GMP phosphodiesterase-like protein
MRLKTALMHTVLPKRRYLQRSILFATLFFLLFNAITLWVIYQANERRQQKLLESVVSFSMRYLRDLQNNMANMNTLTQFPCSLAQATLTQNAAFTRGVRTYLLVKDGVAYCSSATGEMERPVDTIYPALRLDRPQDMVLQQGTYMVPEKPAIGVWLAVPSQPRTGVLATLDINFGAYLLFTQVQGREVTGGLALIIGPHALTTRRDVVQPAAALPVADSRIVRVPRSPIDLRLYGASLGMDDVQLTLLAGLLLACLMGALSYYLMRVRNSADHEMLEGMRRRQFHMEYQPVIDTRSQQVAGVEALMRWRHPREGNIPPDVFISYAEAQGLIVLLTRHLFGLIAQDAPQLQEVLPAGAKLAVNLSPSHLTDPKFEQDVEQFIRQLPPGHFNVVFEITERGMVETEDALEKFAWLRQQGIEIAIDDFGTGHSALIYLEKFQLDFLKIDRGFVTTIGRQTVTAPVLDTVLNLTRELRLKTVAEGVETPQQAHYLREHGVTYLQGYLYSRPLTPAGLKEFVTHYHP